LETTAMEYVIKDMKITSNETLGPSFNIKGLTSWYEIRKWASKVITMVFFQIFCSLYHVLSNVLLNEVFSLSSKDKLIFYMARTPLFLGGIFLT
jgi:hypothetical protein